MLIRILSLRYLRSRPMAWVAGAFLAIMVAAMIVVTAVMEGFQERIRADIRGVEPDLTITLRDPPSSPRVFSLIEARLKGEMRDAGGPLIALAPRAETMGIIQVELGGGSYKQEGVKIRGIDWQRDRRIMPWDRLLDAVEDRRWRVEPSRRADPITESAVGGILVGRSLARDMELRLINQVFGSREASLITGRIVVDAAKKAKVDPANVGVLFAGAFSSGRPDHDGHEVYIPLSTFRTLRYGDDPDEPDCTLVAASVTDPEHVERIAAALERSHPALRVTTWKDKNASLLKALSVEKTVTTVILLVIVILAVSLLMGVLYMMVIEKRRDVGILRSLGLSRGRLVSLFVVYGLLLGTLSVGLGVALGVLAVEKLNAITDWLYDGLGISLFDRDLFASELPTVLSADRVAFIGVASLLLTLIAAAIAAVKAASLEPVDCLNFE